jgi:hypothetical protein
MTQNSKTLVNLLNFLKIPHALFYGTERNLIDLTNLFPFVDIIKTNDAGDVNQLSFVEEDEIKIVLTEDPDLVKKIINLNNKIILSTKYSWKFTKITKEILINIYENHFNIVIPCDIKTQLEQTVTHESLYSIAWKIRLNGGLYNPSHTPVVFERDHPIHFFINKMYTIRSNSKKGQILRVLAKILHQDFLVTGNITLSSYFKLIEYMINNSSLVK